MQIAFGQDNEVRLWCEIDALKENNSIIEFYVINGAWEGTYQDGKMLVHYTQQSYPTEILWAGFAPMSDYNEAIRWINEVISDPTYTIPELKCGDNRPRKLDDYYDADEIPF